MSNVLTYCGAVMWKCTVQLNTTNYAGLCKLTLILLVTYYTFYKFTSVCHHDCLNHLRTFS